MASSRPSMSPIASRTKQCVELFERLHELSLQSSEQRDPSIPSTESVDGLGRFRIWAGNIGALQRYESKSSLDYRLRDVRKISVQIVDLLDDLVESLEDACSIVSNQRSNRTSFIQDPDSVGDHSDDHAPEEGEELSEIKEIFDSITDSINSLFRFSIIIRNNTNRDRYAKATAASTGDPISAQFDINHVREKFPALQAKGKGWLISRLGKAITQRRQYLKYCREHHHKTSVDDVTSKEKTIAKEEVVSSVQLTTKTHTLSGISTLSKPPSTLAQTQASTLILNASQMVEEEITEDMQSQTSYAASNEEDSSNSLLHIVPLDDVSKGMDHFECPYCWQIQAFTTQRAWKKHVLSDLKPYVCTYESCDLKLFNDRDTWFSHELKDHRREWNCRFCTRLPFVSIIKYQEHLSNIHPQSFTEGTLPALLEMSQQSLAKVSPSDCPFCDDWNQRLRSFNRHIPLSDTLVVTQVQFKHHVGGHLEQLALFAIPRGHTEAGDADSGNAAAPGSNLSQLSSQESSVTDLKIANELRHCEIVLRRAREVNYIDPAFYHSNNDGDHDHLYPSNASSLLAALGKAVRHRYSETAEKQLPFSDLSEIARRLSDGWYSRAEQVKEDIDELFWDFYRLAPEYSPESSLIKDCAARMESIWDSASLPQGRTELRGPLVRVENNSLLRQTGESSSEPIAIATEEGERPARLTTPTTGLTPADMWQTYTHRNAWDSVPENEHYIEDLQKNRTSNVQILQDYGSGREQVSIPGSRRNSMKFRATSTELEKPNVPLTSAPNEKPSFWDGERGKDSELLVAEGIEQRSRVSKLAKSSVNLTRQTEDASHLDELTLTPVRNLEEVKSDALSRSVKAPRVAYAYDVDEEGREIAWSQLQAPKNTKLRTASQGSRRTEQHSTSKKEAYEGKQNVPLASNPPAAKDEEFKLERRRKRSSSTTQTPSKPSRPPVVYHGQTFSKAAGTHSRRVDGPLYYGDSNAYSIPAISRPAPQRNFEPRRASEPEAEVSLDTTSKAKSKPPLSPSAYYQEQGTLLPQPSYPSPYPDPFRSLDYSRSTEYFQAPPPPPTSRFDQMYSTDYLQLTPQELSYSFERIQRPNSADGIQYAQQRSVNAENDVYTSGLTGRQPSRREASAIRRAEDFTRMPPPPQYPHSRRPELVASLDNADLQRDHDLDSFVPEQSIARPPYSVSYETPTSDRIQVGRRTSTSYPIPEPAQFRAETQERDYSPSTYFWQTQSPSERREYSPNVHLAQTYQEDYLGPTVPLTAESLSRLPLTAEALRQQTRAQAGSSRSIVANAPRDETDYGRTTTRRATRTAPRDNENMTIKVVGTAKIMVGDTEFNIADGGEVEIAREKNTNDSSVRAQQGSDSDDEGVSGRRNGIARPAGRRRISSKNTQSPTENQDSI